MSLDQVEGLGNQPRARPRRRVQPKLEPETAAEGCVGSVKSCFMWGCKLNQSYVGAERTSPIHRLGFYPDLLRILNAHRTLTPILSSDLSRNHTHPLTPRAYRPTRPRRPAPRDPIQRPLQPPPPRRPSFPSYLQRRGSASFFSLLPRGFRLCPPWVRSRLMWPGGWGEAGAEAPPASWDPRGRQWWKGTTGAQRPWRRRKSRRSGPPGCHGVTNCMMVVGRGT